jgi:cysteine-rich repeat protein
VSMGGVGRLRTRAVVATMGVFACGGRAVVDSGEDHATGGDTIGSEDAATTGAATTIGDGSESTGVEPRCDQPIECGDGLVVPGEACDDANADDGDGCTVDCRRPAPRVIAMLDFDTFANGVIDVDGSIVAIGFGAREIARIAPDGTVLWRRPVMEDARFAAPRSLLVGEQIIVFGSMSDGQSEGVGMLWRFAPDGTPIAVESFPEDRMFLDAALASDRGIVVRTDARVVRFGADVGELWSQPVAAGNVAGLALAADDVAFLHGLSGRDGPPPFIMRVTPGEVAMTPIELPELTHPELHTIAPTPDGGAVVVGEDLGDVIVVRVNAGGEVVWTSTCSSAGIDALPRWVSVIDERIVITGGRRAGPEGVGGCYSPTVVWMQQLALDGSVLATDDPGPLFGPSPFEFPTAIGGGSSQGFTMVVNDCNIEKSAIVHFDW